MENQNRELTQTDDIEVVRADEVEVVDSKESKSEGVSAAAGGIGIEADDVNANVTIGTGDIDKSDKTLENANVTGNVTIDNSTTVNKGPSRFDSAIKMDVPDASKEQSQEMSR